jgi:chaperone BCS1
MDGLLNLLNGNDFLQGGLSLMLVGAVLAGIRFLPHILWEAMWRRFGVTIVIRDQTMVRWLGIWLSEHEFGKRSHWLEATTLDGKDGFDVVLRPGPGLHVFPFRKRRFYLSHELEEAGLAGKISVMNLRVLRPDRDLVGRLIAEVKARANQERVGKTPVFVSGRGYWDLLRLVPKREPQTVFLQPGLLNDVFTDAMWFFDSEAWYRRRGVPYRRGYLLHGEPGNGKSSLVQALASHCDAPIYLLSVTDDEFTDQHLVRVMGTVPPKSLVVLEDFDKVDFSKTGITMAGLLNAIDGPLASEERILIITGNDVSGLGASLLRPGRIDRRWYIGAPSPEAIEECLVRFGVDGQGSAIAAEAQVRGWTMAELQSRLWAQTEVKA